MSSKASESIFENVFYKTGVYDTHGKGSDLRKLFPLLRKLGIKSVPYQDVIYRAPLSGTYQIQAGNSMYIRILNSGDVVSFSTPCSIVRLKE